MKSKKDLIFDKEIFFNSEKSYNVIKICQRWKSSLEKFGILQLNIGM